MRAASRPFFRWPAEGDPKIVLWNEESVSGLPHRLPSGSVDLVVTSPPYNQGVPYGAYQDRRPREEYLKWLGTVANSIDRVLAPQGSFFLNLGGPPKDPWLPWDVAREVGRRFVLQNVIHWIKSIAIERSAVGRSTGLDRDLAVGHYKPVQSPRYLHGAHEYVFHFTRRGDIVLDRLAAGVSYQDKSNIARWRATLADRRCRGNTWFLPYATIRSRDRQRPHPATFPPELAEQCLRLHGLGRVRLCLDPFVGIGNSAIASLRQRVPFVGFDVDPQYLAIAETRIRAEPSLADSSEDRVRAESAKAIPPFA